MTSPTPPAPSVTAVVLAGGTSRRFGGADDDKLDATLDGRSVLDLAISHLPSWPVIVVGPRRVLTERPAQNIRWVREDPPHGGPATALVAALPHVDSTWCAVLAGDTPRGGRLLPGLLALALRDTEGDGGSDGVQAVADGRAQPLLAVYRTAALRAAASDQASSRGSSMRALLNPLRLARVEVEALTTSTRDAHDIDTLADLDAHRRA